MVMILVEEVKEFVWVKLIGVYLNEWDVEKIVDVFVYVDLCSVYLYGVLWIEYYVNRLRVGGINFKVYFVFKEMGFVIGVFDGDDGFGYVICDMVMDCVIDMVKKNGVGMVMVVNSSYCGVLSYFV